MGICIRCGKTYKPWEEERIFKEEVDQGLLYRNMNICLCGQCAIEAARGLEDGIFLVTCEKCGKIFDPWDPNNSYFSEYDTADWSVTGVLCHDCMTDYWNDVREAQHQYR